MMIRNLIMIDHACSDARSVSAMLCGVGDGRERSWLDYEEANKSQKDIELLIAAFTHEARYGRIRPSKKILITRVFKYFLTALAVLFVVF